MKDEYMFVYIPETYSEFSNEYYPVKTKAGNCLHKTLNQAKKKLELSWGVNKGKPIKGKICKYKLVLVDEILTGEYDGAE